ncbi:MAG: DUF2764 family protein [Candidatus Omnitrophota bacterium]
MEDKYYYLVSSLPQLKLDDYKGPYRVNDFVTELYDNLPPRHYDFVKDILRVNDHIHIVNVLLGQETPRVASPGNLTFSQWKENLQNPDFEHAGYIKKFLQEFEFAQKESQKISRRFLENLIEKYFYETMLKHDNYFMREYFKFDFELKNIVLALNQRKFNLENNDSLDLNNENVVVAYLKSSKTGDFGLSKEIDYLPGLMEAFEKKDLVYFEKYLDLLRWQKIEDINVFSYFKIDILLGYLVKLMLVERWISLQVKKGREIFQAKTQINVEALYN